MKNEKYDNYITQKQAGGKIVSPNKSYGSRGERYANQDEEFMSRYNYADDYLMSEGENAFESTVKGMTNRARSAVGTGAEDFAYFLYDNIPGYKPAKTVLNNKTTSEISEKADSQFEDAKANTGAIGDKIIDIADESAEMLGYSMFGPKALYVFATAEGFGEYRSLREQGYSEIDSFVGALGKAGYTVAAEKVEDIAFSKLLNGAMSSNNAVANANLVSDYISNNKNSYLNKSSEMFDDLEYLNYNGENVYTSPYLHEQLEININGETKFIPNGAEFSTVKTIAGNGTEIPIRDVQRLIYTYGGNISDWKKQVGKIESEKYYFDIHWYELDGKQYEPKIKNWGNK